MTDVHAITEAIGGYGVPESVPVCQGRYALPIYVSPVRTDVHAITKAGTYVRAVRTGSAYRPLVSTYTCGVELILGTTSD